MSRSTLITSLVLSWILFSSGCGGGSSQTSPSESLDFKTSGTYDLSQYLIPTQNQTMISTTRIYNDGGGDKKYAATPIEISQSTTRYDVTDTTVKEYTDTVLEATYTIAPTDITLVSDALSTKLVRHADMGDTIIKYTQTLSLQEFNTTFEMPVTCSLTNHINSKATFNNVLEASCLITGTFSGIYNNVDLNGTALGTMTLFLAKNLGLIGSNMEVCYTNNDDNTTTSVCQKTIDEVDSIY